MAVNRPVFRWNNIASQMRPARKANSHRRRRCTTVIVTPLRLF
jgi:hypothetical protein